jgi:hypothetical protein
MFQSATKVLNVRHGRKLFTISTDDKCNGGMVRKVLADHLKTSPSNIRLIAKGAAVGDTQVLEGVTEAMMLFTADYHSQLSGDLWLDQCIAENAIIEEDLIALETGIKHRAITPSAEAQFTRNSILDRIEVALDSLTKLKLTDEAKARDIRHRLEDMHARVVLINLTPAR